MDFLGRNEGHKSLVILPPFSSEAAAFSFLAFFSPPFYSAVVVELQVLPFRALLKAAVVM